ncbi:MULTISPECIES: pentapeptide repeat-containing protein [unclassified Nocardioides]|uniref:pentapeptide repeat-containing protein n=1 Tax=unclassified Nocardioides TaxID=2615069 RepID=UPI00301453B8
MMRAVDLASDCSRCFGLCCTALPFRRSADFAFDKLPDTPCRNLGESYGCGIHTTLRADGMTGCTVFECFGAGQHVAQVTYGGVSWREEPGTASEMFAVFARVRDLHELLVLLQEARGLGADVDDLHDRVAALAAGDPAMVLSADPFALRDEIGPLLDATSRAVRGTGPDHRHADLSGADLRARDLRRGDLRGALLLGTDLRDLDLDRADLLGADLRGADIAGTDLSRALFLTQPQVNAARGSGTTRLSDRLKRPGHWG